MRKALLVARREFLFNVRRPGFLFAAFGVPLLIAGMIALVSVIAVNTESDASRIGAVGYVDGSGVLAQALEQPDIFRAYETEHAARAALGAGEVGAYFVLDADYLESGDVRLYSTSGVPEALKDAIDDFLRVNLGARLTDTTVLPRIESPANVAIHMLDTGRTLSESSFIVLFMLPILFVFIVVMSSQITSGYLMSGVIEEKTNRLMEILITSVTPFQLLLGKVLGLGALGLLQFAVWVGMAVLALRLGQNLAFLEGVALPADLVLVAVVFFVLSYLLYASFMAGVGVVVGSEQESRQFAGFFSFLMMVPFFFIVTFLTDPHSPLAVALTLFPLTAPVTVMMRMGFGVVPVEQLVASIVGLLLTTLVVIWAAARVFRWALLMYGKRPGLRDVIRVIRRAPRPGVSIGKERPA